MIQSRSYWSMLIKLELSKADRSLKTSSTPQSWFSVVTKRKAPTLVIKLNFAKAFDSVNWHAESPPVRGFSPLWCRWMKQLVYVPLRCAGKWHTDTLGPWITANYKVSGKGTPCCHPISSSWWLMSCKGLIMGDGGIRHPLSDCPSPVLQWLIYRASMWFIWSNNFGLPRVKVFGWLLDHQVKDPMQILAGAQKNVLAFRTPAPICAVMVKRL